MGSTAAPILLAAPPPPPNRLVGVLVVEVSAAATCTPLDIMLTRSRSEGVPGVVSSPPSAVRLVDPVPFCGACPPVPSNGLNPARRLTDVGTSNGSCEASPVKDATSGDRVPSTAPPPATEPEDGGTVIPGEPVSRRCELTSRMQTDFMDKVIFAILQRVLRGLSKLHC